MALTRKMLEAMGIDGDKIESIIEAHTETVTGLKAERDQYKEIAEKVDTTEDWKTKYEAEHTMFEAYKNDVSIRETRTAKETALREVYKDAGIAEKYIPALLRIADYGKIELGNDGKLKNHDEAVKTAKAENADFIPVTTRKAAETATPPTSGIADYDSMSDADYYKATYEASKKKG